MSTLKVGTIQDHTNSNNALLIDSSGRVTAPANPKFSASLGTTVSAADYTSASNIGTDAYTVPLDTEDFDIGSGSGNRNCCYIHFTNNRLLSI